MIGAVVVCVGMFAGWAGAEPAPIDFARDVQPILSDKCFHCHGPDASNRKADLRLDTLDPKIGPLAPRDGYAIVAPGKVDDSVLVMRITSDDAETKMPPPASHRTLTKEQIETLTRWVAEGAKWGKHWSFEPPRKPELPKVKDEKWGRNGIDRFILARLEKEGMKPSAEADKRTLIRRVTLDLTGLPPTPAEVDAFVADQSGDAYEKVVDRLLASPRYGERMVWEWLSAARYADTNGYQGDPTRTMWPWRDWAIRAMNENVPFDRFTVEQIAGDLLPKATPDQRLASAFNRCHPFNGEGGRIPEETRVENVMDRTDTTATVFLGLTVGCAKCHDHKYDPISQKEYYQLSAYFNQSSETGRAKYSENGGNVLPVMAFTTAEQEGKLAELRKAEKAAAAALAKVAGAVDAKQAEWEKSVGGVPKWERVTPSAAWSRGGASMQIIEADGSVLVFGKSPDNDVHEVVVRTDAARVAGLRIEALPDVSLPQGGPGRSTDSGNFVLTDLEAEAVPVADGKAGKVKFAYGDATFSQTGFSAGGVIDGDPVKTGWAVHKATDKSNLSAVFALAEPVTMTGGVELRLRFHYAWPSNKQHTIGRFRLAVTDGTPLPADVAAAVAVEPGKRTEEQKNRVRDFHRTSTSAEYRKASEAAAAAKKEATEFDKSMTKVMVMDDAMPRKTHVLAKGAYDKPEAEVSAGVLGVLHPMPKAGKNDRVALAKWLVDPANPLTARVTVNRYWQQFFGVGIVKTVDDFGVQGERPVHPELLDWLAVDFRDDGKWDVKRLVRMIVTSSTYRQSSKVTPELLEKDPENRLLGRGSRFRLPAVTIRDQALAASGLLVEKVGGPPVKPYQPPGVWEEATFGFIKYQQDHGEALYRRSVYVFWRRIVGPTEFFDEPGRSTCVVKPSRTNTPLQALTTLNSTTFVEAARAMAQRVMTTGGSTADDRLAAAYRFALGRGPSAKERGVFLAALDRLRKEYESDRPAALKLLSVGESKRDEKLDPVEHAAYTGVCLAILNLDETLTKE